MKASEIISSKYGSYSDKMEVTLLAQEVRNAERENSDEKGTFEAVATVLREWVASRRTSESIKELCIECVKHMQY